MSKVLVLNRKEVEGLISMPMALSAVEEAYRMKGTAQAEIWPMVFHVFDPDHRGDLDIKSGNMPGRYGLKVVSWFGENEKKGLPALVGTELLFDMETGLPTALLNAGPITAFRTGASAAIGAKYLAPKNPRKLCIVGCGALAPYVAAAYALVFPDLQEMVIVNPHHPIHATEKVGAIRSQAEQLAGRTIRLVAETDAEAAVRASDLVATITPSTSPVVLASWLHPGMQLSCIGADMAGKQELESACVKHALCFCDDCSQSLSVGEFEVPFHEGVLRALDGEIGAVVAGKATGRTREDEIAIFDASGIALLDIAMAQALVEKAEDQGVGSTVTL